jgi:hypothetical protein
MRLTRGLVASLDERSSGSDAQVRSRCRYFGTAMAVLVGAQVAGCTAASLNVGPPSLPHSSSRRAGDDGLFAAAATVWRVWRPVAPSLFRRGSRD